MTHIDDLRDEDIEAFQISQAQASAESAYREAEEVKESLGKRMKSLEKIISLIGAKYVDSFSDLDKSTFYVIAGDYKKAKHYAGVEFEKQMLAGEHAEALRIGEEYGLPGATI